MTKVVTMTEPIVSTVAVPPKSFEVVTTAQVERTYTVQAASEDQARARLRTYLADPYMLRDGVVTEQTGKQTDTTAQRIKDVSSGTARS